MQSNNILIILACVYIPIRFNAILMSFSLISITNDELFFFHIFLFWSMFCTLLWFCFFLIMDDLRRKYITFLMEIIRALYKESYYLSSTIICLSNHNRDSNFIRDL